MAVCDKPSTVHFVVDGHPAVLGIVEFMAESFCRQWHPNLDISTVSVVTCLPLQDLLEIISMYHIDFFSLDVQGGELAVLQTIDFKKVFISSWQMVFISSAMLAPVLLRNTNFGNPHSAG